MIIGTTSNPIIIRFLLVIFLINVLMPDMSAVQSVALVAAPRLIVISTMSDRKLNATFRTKRSPKGGGGRGGRGGGAAGGMGKGGGRAVGLGTRHVTPFKNPSSKTNVHAVHLLCCLVVSLISGLNKHIT